MMSPIRLPFGWWLCRDSGRPVDYPPLARDEMVQARLAPFDRRVRRIDVLDDLVMPRLESQCVNGDIVSDMHTGQLLRCLQCQVDLTVEGHRGTCSRSVMRGGSPWPEAGVDLERLLRQEWWMNHGCPPGSQYGDDGEMSCGSCGLDFKRMPVVDLHARVGVQRWELIRARARAGAEAWEAMRRG